MLTVQTAADFMRRDLVTLSPTTSVAEGAASLLRHHISGAPVVDKDRQYLGVFSEKCCFKALSRDCETANQAGRSVDLAPGFMARELLVLHPSMDVFEAIDKLLAKKVSGAPVLDDQQRFMGSFSEKTAMRVLVTSAYENVPGGDVGSYMNPDQARVISEETSLLEAGERFKSTPFRRLPVLRGTTLLGQVSRRDVLRGQVSLTAGHSVEAESEPVMRHMDVIARTIEPGDDLLTIAQVFETTPYRRLPVIEGGELRGQVSRRDLLRAATNLIRPEPERPHAEVLYLSSLLDAAPPEVRG